MLTLKRFVLAGTVAVLLAGLLAPSSIAAPSASLYRYEEAHALWIVGNHAPYTGYMVEAFRRVVPTDNKVRTRIKFWRAPCRRLQEDLLCVVSHYVHGDIEPQDLVMYPTVHGARLTFDQGGKERVFTWSGDVEPPAGYAYGVGPQGGYAFLWQWNWPYVEAEGTMYGRHLSGKDTDFGGLMTITSTYAYAPPPREPREIPWGDDGGRVIIRHSN